MSVSSFSIFEDYVAQPTTILNEDISKLVNELDIYFQQNIPEKSHDCLLEQEINCETDVPAKVGYNL